MNVGKISQRLFPFQEIVGDVFEDEDTVTIIKDESSRAGKAKNIKNQIEEEIRLVILNTRKDEPVFVPVGRTKAISFSSTFSNKVEIYR